MKNTAVLILLFGVIAMLAGCGTGGEVSNQGRHNLLAPQKGGKTTVALIHNGKPALRILLPSTPSEIEQKAAALLKQALDAGTGSVFEIVNENNYTQGAVLSLGETALYKKSGIKPIVDLKAEGYMIRESQGNIFLIGGRKRGAISPAIALIEEDLGGRMYSALDGLKMPKLLSNQEIVSREYTPHFELRTMFQFESFNAEFQLFNRVGTSDARFEEVPADWGGYTALPKKYFVHTCWSLLPNDEYFDKHPEYFSLVDGKRIHQGHGGGGHFCWTNKDVRRIVTAKVLKELETYHPYEMFDISPNDSSGGFCQCENCHAIAIREGSEAGPLLEFVNAVAREVKKKYPHVKITTMAYAESKKPPKTLRPEPNVIIRLANEFSARYPMFNSTDCKSFIPYLEGWHKLGADIFIWDYTVNYGGWPMPWPNLEVIDYNIDLYKTMGVKALFLQSSHYGPGENQGRLRSWAYAKKMWDPSLKIQDLVRDFNQGYYGKAGDLMQAYSDLLLDEYNLYRKTHEVEGSTRRSLTLSDAYYPKAKKIFEDALALAGDDQQLKEKIEFDFISVLFYRLETIPPVDKSDKVAYVKTLDQFRALTTKYKVEWMNESITRTPARIIEWKRKHDIVSPDDKPVTLMLNPTDASKVGNGAKLYDDISVPGGKVIKLPMDGKEWAVQWFFGSALFKNVTYSAKIQVRVDKKQEKGLAIVGGIYSITLKKNALDMTLDAADLSNAGYKWIDCGTFNGSDAESAYFFLSQDASSVASNVYITNVKLVPQLKNVDVK